MRLVLMAVGKVEQYTPPKERYPRERYPREPPSDIEKTKKNLELILAIGLAAGALVAGGVAAHTYYEKNFAPVINSHVQGVKTENNNAAASVMRDMVRGVDNYIPPQPTSPKSDSASLTALLEERNLLTTKHKPIRMDVDYPPQISIEDRLALDIEKSTWNARGAHAEIVHDRLPERTPYTGPTMYYPGYVNSEDTSMAQLGDKRRGSFLDDSPKKTRF